MPNRKALVTGVAGQDGSYMVDHLLAHGYEVVGVGRGLDSVPAREGLALFPCDITEPGPLSTLLRIHRPREVYNLAALSSGSRMFDDALLIGETNGIAVVQMLEAIRQVDRDIRFCQASSSEMFGDVQISPQSESTPFNPRSPYGAAKVYAHSMLQIYRDRYDMFTCSAILFNHESPLRRPEFVTRKVTQAAAHIKLGLASEVLIGNLDAKRDWGFAGDYMRAMWLMLQHETPQDYVVATGQLHSVRELCEIAFSHVELDYRRFVRECKTHYRKAETADLLGDARRAREALGWTPSIDFRTLIRSMVDAELAELRGQAMKEQEIG